MKQRVFHPRKMDVGVFIESGEPLAGDTPVVELSRLCAGLPQEADVAALGPVRWQVQGRTVPQRVGAPQWWLDVRAQARLPYECQRCLHPVMLDVEVDRDIRFVADEAAAAHLDAESDEDVLAVSRQFNLLELIEDELIMAEPILPRHDECPVDLNSWMQPGSEEAAGAGENPGGSPDPAEPGATDRPNPFAVLAALKNKKTPDSSDR